MRFARCLILAVLVLVTLVGLGFSPGERNGALAQGQPKWAVADRAQDDTSIQLWKGRPGENGSPSLRRTKETSEPFYGNPFLNTVSAHLTSVISPSQTSSEEAKESRPPIRVPQDYPTIQEAIANAEPGDIIEVDATPGPYRGPIVIDISDLIIRSVNGQAVIEGESDEVVIRIESDSIELEGFVVKGGETGILLDHARKCNLRNNYVEDSKQSGIQLFSSLRNTLVGNQALNNGDNGIHLQDSTDNKLENNITEGNEDGIVLLSSSNGNTLVGNQALNNEDNGIHLQDSTDNKLENNITEGNEDGIVLLNSNMNTLVQNQVCNNGKSGVWLEGSSDNKLESNATKGNGDGIMLLSSNTNTLVGNQALNNRIAGIYLEGSNDNKLESNITKDNPFGIVLDSSNANTLVGNQALNNGYNGIHLYDSSDNELENNITEGNEYEGIALLNSNTNTLVGNQAYSNKDSGIWLQDSSDNELESNTTEGNGDGISLLSSSGNTLVENRAHSNGDSGIWLQDSNENKLKNDITEGNEDGIMLLSSSSNTLLGNQTYNNKKSGIQLQDSTENKLENNITEGNEDGIMLLSSNMNTLVGNQAYSNGDSGIQLQDSTENKLENNITEGNLSGIVLDSSSSNILLGNQACNNSLAGIGFLDSSGNRLENNTTKSNEGGITLLSSSSNNLLGNQAHNNSVVGVGLKDSNENKLANNSTEGNIRGIYSYVSHNNTLTGNLIDQNVHGLLMEGSNENSIGLVNNGNLIENNKIGIDVRGGGGNTFRANTVEGNVYGVILDNFDINYFCFPPFYELISGYGTRCMPYQDNNNTVRNNRKGDIQIPGLVKGEFLVQFGKEVSTEEAEQIIQGTGSVVIDYFQHLDIYHLRLPPEVQTGANQAEVFRQAQLQVNQFNGLAQVAFAELDVNLGLAEEQYPDDLRFDQQWNLFNEGQRHYTREGEAKRGKRGADIGILDAWNSGITDSSDVYVAIIDTGSTVDHPDLKGNLDFRLSHDFVNRDETPLDHHGHGTFIAGIIGAIGNNGEGIAGISWKASIITLQVGDVFVIGGIRDDTRSGMSSILAAVEHVLDLKERGFNVRVVNFSLGYRKPLESLRIAMDKLEEAGILVVTAAGNRGDGTKGAGWNNDAANQGIYPCNFENENIICVGASTDEDELAGFSNYGMESVDLVAPGEDIVSLVPSREAVITAGAEDIPLLANHPARLDDYTGVGSGTSFAAPHVTGVAALLFAICPGKSAVEIKNIILNSVEKLDSLEGKVKSGGRLKWPDELPEGCQALAEK